MKKANVCIFILLNCAIYNNSAKPFSEQVENTESSIEEGDTEGDSLPVQPVKSTEHKEKLVQGQDEADSSIGCSVEDAKDDETKSLIPSLGRNAVLEEKYLWKNKRFDVYLDPIWKFSSEERQDIELMLGKLQDVFGDCLKIGLFPPGVKPKRSDHVVVDKRPGECGSQYTGRKGPGTQFVSLPDGWLLSYKAIIHEFMHALGLKHEHTRADRDNYINIHWENIDPRQRHNFDKVDARHYGSYGVDYNYNSLMHYGVRTFSKNGKTTMVAKDDPRRWLGGNSKGNVPESDRLKLRRMYKCGD